VLAGGEHRLAELPLPLRMLRRLLDGMLAQELLGGDVEVEVLRVREGAAAEPLAHAEEIFPLRAGARRVDGRHGRPRRLEAVGASQQRDDAVALGDVLFEPLDQCARSDLEILLHLDLAADGPQIARERVAAGLELRADGRKEDLHGAERLAVRV